jgi:hypothetical protein
VRLGYKPLVLESSLLELAWEGVVDGGDVLRRTWSLMCFVLWGSPAETC